MNREEKQKLRRRFNKLVGKMALISLEDFAMLSEEDKLKEIKRLQTKYNIQGETNG